MKIAYIGHIWREQDKGWTFERYHHDGTRAQPTHFPTLPECQQAWANLREQGVNGEPSVNTWTRNAQALTKATA